MKLRVNAGVCGFVTLIEATSEDMQNVVFLIESDCPNIQRFKESFSETDAYDELKSKFEGAIHTASKNANLCTAGCPVPAALHKAAQVTAGLALPRDASIEFE